MRVGTCLVALLALLWGWPPHAPSRTTMTVSLTVPAAAHVSSYRHRDHAHRDSAKRCP
ncbi:MAG: hypothetical protein U5Q44_06765 [Dehalococcoidia bacterium]|nr:hypothetical protein [Dehalococcoidia bacterium]